MSLKQELGVQEGKKGERTYRNVIANSLVPLLAAICAFASGGEYYNLMANTPAHHLFNFPCLPQTQWQAKWEVFLLRYI